MKKIIFIAVALVLSLALNSFAKEQPKPAAEQETAAADTQKQEVKTIFSYKSELALSDKQEAEIKKFLVDLQNIFVEKAKTLNTLRQELNQMIRDRGNLRTIRKKIDDIAKIQADNTYLDIEISRKIENALSAGQLKKWQDIQKEAREKARAEAESKAKPAAESKTKAEPAAKQKK